MRARPLLLAVILLVSSFHIACGTGTAIKPVASPATGIAVPPPVRHPSTTIDAQQRQFVTAFAEASATMTAQAARTSPAARATARASRADRTPAAAPPRQPVAARAPRIEFPATSRAAPGARTPVPAGRPHTERTATRTAARPPSAITPPAVAPPRAPAPRAPSRGPTRAAAARAATEAAALPIDAGAKPTTPAVSSPPRSQRTPVPPLPADALAPLGLSCPAQAPIKGSRAHVYHTPASRTYETVHPVACFATEAAATAAGYRPARE